MLQETEVILDYQSAFSILAIAENNTLVLKILVLNMKFMHVYIRTYSTLFRIYVTMYTYCAYYMYVCVNVCSYGYSNARYSHVVMCYSENMYNYGAIYGESHA